MIVNNGILLKYNGTEANVTVPAKVKVILDAFSGNTAIKGVSIEGKVHTIDSAAFLGCTSLALVKISAPVERIGKSAFYNCKSLAKIYLPDSLQTVELGAFSSCKGLVNVSYAGKEAAWGKVTVEKNNDPLLAADRQYGVKP